MISLWLCILLTHQDFRRMTRLNSLACAQAQVVFSSDLLLFVVVAAAAAASAAIAAAAAVIDCLMGG